MAPRKRKPFPVKRLLVSLSLLVSAGCLQLSRPVPISKVRKENDRYRREAVVIQGVVKRHLPMRLGDENAYVLEDKTGSIIVRTLQAMPPEGSTVRVKGRLTDAVKAGPFRMGDAFSEEARMEVKR